jgi:hypothetical protein
MTRLDALEGVSLAAGIIYSNATRQPDGNYSIPAIDYQMLDEAIQDLYKTQKRHATQRTLFESEAA